MAVDLKQRWKSVTGGLVFLLALGYFAALAPYGLELADEGHLVHQLYRTFLGQLPYVDFHTGYTPGMYYWNAALLAIFGVKLTVVRFGLALCNAATVFLMYVVARRLRASRPAAAAAGVFYLGLIPFYDGHFAPFNIPYPAWYVTPFWLLSILFVLRALANETTLPWAVAGVCAGIAFAFKQNGGLLNLAAIGITLALVMRPARDDNAARSRIGRLALRVERTFHWLLPLCGALALVAMVGCGREAWIFVAPLLIVVLSQLLIPGAGVVRTVPPFRLWRAGLAAACGFALVTVPWASYFWSRLGTALFLRSILYIGTGYKSFYFIAHPPLGLWAFGVAAGLLLLVLAGLMLRTRKVPASALAVLVAVGALTATFRLVRKPPPMVEGFQASVRMRIEDIAFPLLLCVAWAAIAVLVTRAMRRRADVAGATPAPLAAGIDRDATLLVVLVSAILMHGELYPRSDFTHLVFAAPGLLIVGAVLLDRLAALWAEGLTDRPAHGRILRAAFLLPVYAVALILLAPALERIEYLARAGLEADPTAVVALETPRAPLVLEPSAGRLFVYLSDTVRYLDANSTPQEYIFTFPCLDFISFLADRRDPTRHGYYYPGSPGHAVEAEVIDSLRDHPPRFIVALHDHALFFTSAPLYYFNLRRYVTQHYELDRRMGMFDILSRREAGAAVRQVAGQAGGVAVHANSNYAPGKDLAGDGLAETIDLWERELAHLHGKRVQRVAKGLAALPSKDTAALADLLLSLDPPAQRTIALLVRKSRSPGGAAALAARVGDEQIDPTLREFFLRTIAAVGDLQSVPPLLHALEDADPAMLAGVSGDLYTISSLSWFENYWYVPPERTEWRDIEEALPDRQIIAWIDNPWEIMPLRVFAIRMAASRPGHRLVPFLVRVLGDSNENWLLRADAAQSLVELGFGKEIFAALTGLVRRGELVPPMLTTALYQQAPDVGYELVTSSMAAVDDMARAEAFWVAGGLHDRRMVEPLRAGLSDPAREVRMAAVWGLGNSGDPSVLGDLRRMARDGDDEVEQFAERAIRHVLRSEE
jgi:HEAT repeat protein